MRFKSIFLKLIIFTWMILQGFYAFSQEDDQLPQVVVPNTQVKIAPPEHFVLSDQFTGFIHGNTASTILITEMPNTNVVMVMESMEQADLSSQGVTKISEEEVTLNSGDKGTIFLVSFVVDDIPFERMMFFTGDYQNTIKVDVNYPAKFKSLVYDALKASLLTVEFSQ